jgi:HAD superfamily hydrolase (TIGR01509 family)
MKRFATVLFDWDGTLCDSGAALHRAFVKALAEFGISFSLAEYQAVYTPAWYRMYEAFGLRRDSWRLADQRWLHHFDGEEPGLLPGAAGVIDCCRCDGLQVGIVTGATRDRIRREFARLGLSFGAIICHEDVVNRKPHPEGITKALALLNARTEDCCFVGDAPEDIEMGKRAGVCTVGVVTEYVTRGRMEAAAPDVLIEDIEELRGVLAMPRSPSIGESSHPNPDLPAVQP